MDPCTVDPGGLDPGKDLPLMANTAYILVRHFILDLRVSFKERSFAGNILLFTEPNPRRPTTSPVAIETKTTLDEVIDHSCIGSSDVGGKVEGGLYATQKSPEELSQGAGGQSISTDELLSTTTSGDDAEDNKNCEQKLKPFYFTLDCCNITVHAVEEIPTDKSPTGTQKEEEEGESKLLEDTLGFDGFDSKARNTAFWNCKDKPGKPLNFTVEPWCIKIWKDGVHDVKDFPQVVKIYYHSNREGTSVSWAHDQDNNLCAFTQGTWINNRALFPCQEPPTAMSTWQAVINAPSEYVVLMSGDDEAVTKQLDDGSTDFLYHINVPAPSSTLTIAIGQWRRVSMAANKQPTPVVRGSSSSSNRTESSRQCQHNEKWPCRVKRYDEPVLPCCIYAPPSLLEGTVHEFGESLPMYLQAVFELLGPHPFSRLDLLIVPKCFSSLGMASPSIIFLSQSLLSGDHSMCIRLAHEISHSWFGLIIGARDWTEEWMSEGFATYMEDLIHAKAKQLSPEEQKAHSDLRSLLRYRALKAELENTEEELQTLRPSGSDTKGSESLDGEVTFVKNGLNHEKGFMQVHYIKGYFLLRYLANLVGQSNFDSVIRQYVLKFHCQQVLSQELFKLYFDAFPQLRDQGITMDTIYHNWLDYPGMPKNLNPEDFTQNNSLVEEVNAEFNRWLHINSLHQKGSKKSQRKKMKLSEEGQHAKLIPDQLVLLLEKLLELDMISKAALNELDRVYNVSNGNADVRHRWCELLVKHQHRLRYSDVKRFLIDDQAMGVYLYGELMVAEKPQERKLAEECFLAVAKEMDFGCRKIVQEMIYGEIGELGLEGKGCGDSGDTANRIAYL